MDNERADRIIELLQHIVAVLDPSGKVVEAGQHLEQINDPEWQRKQTQPAVSR